MRREDFTSESPGRLIRIGEPDVCAYLPAPLPESMDLPSAITKKLEQASGALGELKGLGQHLPNPNLLIRPFMQKEAVLSSRIEGTQTSLAELMLVEAEEKKDQSQNPDAQEVQNYMKALDYALGALEELPICLRMILEAHRHLLAGVRGQGRSPGEVRRSPVHIGYPGSTAATATYVPPPANELNDLLKDLEGYINREDDTPRLVRLALIHYQFEAIHPFLDGNGRVGRLLITLLLRAWDLLPQPMLYLSAYFEERRSTYYELLLSVSQRGAWHEWITFFLEGITLQSRDACLRARKLLELRGEYLDWAKGLSYGGVPGEIVEALFLAPTVNIQMLTRLTDRSAQGIGKHLEPMLDRGILLEITGRQRGRIFRAPEILRLLEMEFDHASPELPRGEKHELLRSVTRLSETLDKAGEPTI